MAPTAIFDKSALQMLSPDEAVWFDAFFRVNVVPLFYVETLADLEKKAQPGRTPEGDVARLAEKTPSRSMPNVHHRTLIVGDLIGNTVAMDGRALVAAGTAKAAPDGKIGWHVDEVPEAAMLRRWNNGEFLAPERALAQHWRRELARLDPVRHVSVIRNVVPRGRKFSDLAQMKAYIDSFCASHDPHVIDLALDILAVPDQCRRVFWSRWEAAGRPRFDVFVPYAAHIFKVDVLFYLAIDRGFISSERASNAVDMAYLYYLPFAHVFISHDKLHRRTAPLFLRSNQSYLHADEFKAALRSLDAHYTGLPEQIKELGVMRFALYPPYDGDDTVTRLWDSHHGKAWRLSARAWESEMTKPRDEQADRQTVSELNHRLDHATTILDPDARIQNHDIDYFAVRQLVPTTKGKWRILPNEVEDAQPE